MAKTKKWRSENSRCESEAGREREHSMKKKKGERRRIEFVRERMAAEGCTAQEAG